MSKSDLDRDSLKIGDYVVFNDASLGCFLSVEGILLEELVGVDVITSLHDAIFCIHLQRQYSAARELNAFLEKYSMDVKNITEDSEIKYLQALERGTENENKLNDNYMKKKLGQVVLFGDIIQLYHVKSGKYLQVVPGKLAKDERENVRVGLDVNGNAFSWLQVCPRFKIDKDGDRILSNVEAYLKVAERNNEFIHSAHRDPQPGHEREVNCSLESTSWRLNIFQSSTDALDKSLLLASQIVYIQDPESLSNLTVAEQKVESLDDSEEPETGKVSKFSDSIDEDEEKEEDDPEEEPEKVVLRPTTAQYIDSNFLWFLEGGSILTGGPIKWKTDQVRFKHMNTGLYLCQETRHTIGDDGVSSTKTWAYTTVNDSSISGTLFSVNELNSTAKFLCSGKASQIGHSGVWMERGPILQDSMFTFKVQGTKDKSAAVSLVVNHYFGHGIGAAAEETTAAPSVAKSKETEEDHEEEESDSKASAQGPKQPLDVFAGLSARNYLDKYYKMTKLDQNSSANTIWPTASRSDMEMFKMIVAKTVIFAQGFPISATNVKIGIDKSDPELRRRRQNLLREQNTLEIVLRMINKLIPLSEASLERLTAANVDASFLIKMGRTVLELCFTVLYNGLQDNQENQMYVADFMPVLLAHLNTQPVAVKCVTEMLSKNLDLQETKIGTREIQIFVDKLRSSKMNAMYLQLLQACCSCQGKGVDGNQCKVANMLFDGDFSDIVVKLEVSYARRSKVHWAGDTHLYLTPPGGADATVRSNELISQGLPILALKFQRNGESIHASFTDVFAAQAAMTSTSFDEMDKVDLTYMTSVKNNQSFKLRRDPSSSNVDPHTRLGTYFVAEMFLGAEMCMDRNYVAMHKLDDLFTYESLVTILKMEVSSNVKSAAIRLLMCLHVDRDPQASSKIPMLTRSWGDIKKNNEPQLPYVEVSRQYTFGLIQQMISEHIRAMSGNRWDELSRHMLKMLRTLVQFNFYGTNERMKDVMAPLIKALDRRSIDFATIEGVDLNKSSKALVADSDSRGGAHGFHSVANENFGEDSSLENDSFRKDIADDESILSSLADLRHSVKSQERRQRHQRVLDVLDSPRFYVAMMMLVLADIGVDIYSLITNETFDIPSVIFLIEAATLLVFVIEILVRAFCLFRIDGNFTGVYYDFFNMCDLVAVGVAIAVLFIPEITKGLLLVIALRAVKVYRMLQMSSARIIAGEDSEVKLDGFKTSARYSIAPIHELETMVEVVDILAFMQKLVEDRNISLVMHYFYKWESGTERRSPADLFDQVVEDSKQLSLNIADFDNVMLDVLMFVHMPLVQSTLEVLMAHHSLRRTLLSNVQQVQLLVSSKREKQYREVNAMLQELEQNAETHELWGELETDKDRDTNERTKDIIKQLISICRVRHFVLEFDEEFMADKEIQDLYRNLGCFEICMKVMGLLDSVEEDEYGNFSEVALNTRDLCLQCNTLLYWYFLGNPLNQEQGFGELDFFLSSLDDEIKSHLVIGAIFKMNEKLMRLSPHSHLDDLVKKILNNGKSHHYLALFASISNVGDKNIVENQFQIVKILTSPGRLQNIACFFCPVDHPDYAEKRALMAPFLHETRDLTLDDLPPLLAYHLMFLEVLSDCTVGRLNITTVEAKVQSVFHYVDILQSILDSGTIIFTQIRLSMFFYNSIIEVELKIPGLEQSAYIWQLLQTYDNVLGYAKDELRTVEKAGWESPDVSRQRIEYIIVCILITGGFFSRYYDTNTFRYADGGAQQSSDKVHITLAQVNNLIKSLFDKIKDVYDLDSPRLSAETKGQIFSTLESLNKSSTKIIDNNLVPNNSRLRDTVRTDVVSGEAKLVEKFQDFHKAISEDKNIKDKCESENVYFISILEALPTILSKVDADVRYETLIRKLVQHIRDNFKYVNGEKRLDARVTKTSTWIIRCFRTMIENRMEMSIYERDDEGGADEDEKAAPVVNALNNCGATALCLDLIAFGIDKDLQMEAVKLGVGLLFKEGGALEVQGIMNNHLNKGQSELFFKQVRQTLENLQAWHTWNEGILLAEGEEPNPPDEILIVRFLQLMCEGHYLSNQDIMREQPNNKVAYNLLDDFVSYLNCLSRLPCRTSTTAAIRLSATILEVIQGPCEGNQAHFALNTELIETLNRINRAKLISDCVEEEETELKKTSIDIFQGLLEGQGEKSVVYERVLSVIHLDIIQMMSKGVGVPDTVRKDGSLQPAPEPSEEQEILQTECVVLLQMLCNFKPSLYDELGISKDIDEIVGSGTAMIEVVWRGDIHRRFFHVPSVCDYLAKSSKDSLVENVDRSNSENKLIDFLARSHDLYREVKHQQLLTEMNLSRVFSREIQNIATWITFGTAVLINVMFIAYYNYNAGHARPSVTFSTGLTVINAFNIFQNIVGAFVVIMNVVVRSPVIYQSLMASGLSKAEAVVYTACDPKTLYFGAYLVLSLLGLLAADYYLPFLLLDIVAKNATTRDVLNAVVIPRKQLGMTVVLAIFVTYIFAYFIFKYYRDDLGGLMGDGVYPGDSDCDNLWGCFKFVLCYGVRQGGGVGEMLKLTIGFRWLIDATYFIVLIVMMLNIIFGIIIDTFSSLRAEKNARTEDTEGVCFICGINNQVFDRASDEPDGFKKHIKLDHNMWNYLYFIFMLWEQDKDDDDGLEQYVRRAIEANEIIWFPLHKAIRLDQAATEEEITLREIESEIRAFEESLGRKISHFQTEMSVVLEHISHATRLEHRKGGVKDGIAAHLQRSMIAHLPTDDGADNMSDIAVAGGSVLDTIEENDTMDEDTVQDGRSTVSDNGLHPLHEGSEDEGSESDDDILNAHTYPSTTSGTAQQPATEEERAPFPGSRKDLPINATIEGPSILIKERSNAFWDMDTSSVPGTPAIDSYGQLTNLRERPAPATPVIGRPVAASEEYSSRSSYGNFDRGLFPTASQDSAETGDVVLVPDQPEPGVELLVLDRPSTAEYPEETGDALVEQGAAGSDMEAVVITDDASAFPVPPANVEESEQLAEDAAQSSALPMENEPAVEDASQVLEMEVEPAAEPEDRDTLEEPIVQDDANVTGEPADEEHQPHEEERVIAQQSVRSAEQEEEEFMPEVEMGPRVSSINYLSGDSFRVTHTAEEDSLHGGNSQVSLGADSVASSDHMQFFTMPTPQAQDAVAESALPTEGSRDDEAPAIAQVVLPDDLLESEQLPDAPVFEDQPSMIETASAVDADAFATGEGSTYTFNTDNASAEEYASQPEPLSPERHQSPQMGHHELPATAEGSLAEEPSEVVLGAPASPPATAEAPQLNDQDEPSVFDHTEGDDVIESGDAGGDEDFDFNAVDNELDSNV